MTRRSVTWVILLLLLGEAIDAAAQFCFKQTALALGEPSISSASGALAFAVSALSQGYLWIGMGIVLLVFIGWGIVLSKVDLSVAMPLTSISYLFVALTSVVFLHEHISGLRWLGIGLILIGVMIVAKTSEHPEKKS